MSRWLAGGCAGFGLGRCWGRNSGHGFVGEWEGCQWFVASLLLVLGFGVGLLVGLWTVSAVEVVWVGIGFSLFGIEPVRC